jgi:DNA-binding transcriptional LysR family regulator
LNWLETAGRDGRGIRDAALRINNLLALLDAVVQGVGIAVLPDYLAQEHPRMIMVLEDVEMPQFDTYFVYPQDLKDTKRVNVFRDFLIAKSREWSF